MKVLTKEFSEIFLLRLLYKNSRARFDVSSKSQSEIAHLFFSLKEVLRNENIKRINILETNVQSTFNWILF